MSQLFNCTAYPMPNTGSAAEEIEAMRKFYGDDIDAMVEAAGAIQDDWQEIAIHYGRYVGKASAPWLDFAEQPGLLQQAWELAVYDDGRSVGLRYRKLLLRMLGPADLGDQLGVECTRLWGRFLEDRMMDIDWERMAVRLEGREIWIDTERELQSRIDFEAPELLCVDDLRSACRMWVLPLDGEPIPPHWGIIVDPELGVSEGAGWLRGTGVTAVAVAEGR
jgi:hypothetical protein